MTEKKSVGIVTIESMNFGNRLQNYALQELLVSVGCYVETFHRIQNKKGAKDIIKRIAQNILQSKAAKYRKFDKRINFSDFVLGTSSFPSNIAEAYDYFVVGSDQVWNPCYDKVVASECDFLAFAPVEKRIAYAPSFGISVIPDEKKEYYAEKLSGFAHLSVREEAGADIIYSLTGRKAPIVLDPTLMIDRRKWESVIEKSKYVPKGKYVLVYALGDIIAEYKDAIEYYALQYEIFDIRRIMSNGHELAIGPAEFLYAIHNAEVVLTDSFHCTAFSLIFEKKVYSFDRAGASMNSRIQTLHTLLGIEQKDYKEIEIDYKELKERLDVLQKHSKQYLMGAIGLL